MKARLTSDQYVEGVLSGNKNILSRAITLIESKNEKDRILAAKVLDELMPYTGKSIRLGITGAPGAGKSTFIDQFGQLVLSRYNKLAVLAIDPSSTESKGSIMGDKTRMGELAGIPNAYVRPSASGTTQGGVARKTRESLLFCEAAGYDFIIVETVGVGQSEVAVKNMIDFLLLLISPVSGDELQGLKKGIVELADGIAITKCDGKNTEIARQSQKEYQSAIQIIKPKDKGSAIAVTTCSALENLGLEKVLSNVEEVIETDRGSGKLERSRNEQLVSWMHEEIKHQIVEEFYQLNSEQIKSFEQEVQNRKISPQTAVFGLSGKE